MPALLDVMGEFTDPFTLALVGRCSKTTSKAIRPILDVKMYDLIRTLFKGITSLPVARSAAYYRTLLKKYFRTTRNIPLSVEINHWVGNLVGRDYEFKQSISNSSSYFVWEAMDTAEGRRRVLKSIDEWRLALKRTTRTSRERRERTKRLDILTLRVNTSFAIVSGGIGAEYMIDLAK